MRSSGGARPLLIALGSVLAIVLVCGVVWVVGREGSSGTVSKAETTTTTTAPEVETDEATIATTTGGPIDVYAEPVEGAPVQTTLSALTEESSPPAARTLLVIDDETTDDATTDDGIAGVSITDVESLEWLHVLLPIRPNGSTGWIRNEGVTLSTTPYEIRIELATHKLTLLNNDEVVLEAQTVNGAENTPTPLGEYYISDPWDLQAQPNGGYGAYALGISGFSEVLMEFNGGPGQIAVHGTVQTQYLGQDVSNGCIRVDNPTILQIVNTLPERGLGTPVTIVA